MPAKWKRITHPEGTCEKNDKKRLQIERNYFTKPGCFNGPSNTCTLTLLQRKEELQYIDIFWSLDYSGQKTFVLERVDQQSVKNRQADKDEQRKSICFKYTPKGEHVPCQCHEVCKKLFLAP